MSIRLSDTDRKRDDVLRSYGQGRTTERQEFEDAKVKNVRSSRKKMAMNDDCS